MADHECPWPGCERQIPFEKLACGPHWYRLPRELRNRIWRAWRGQGTERHSDLVVEAIATMDRLAAGAS